MRGWEAMQTHASFLATPGPRPRLARLLQLLLLVAAAEGLGKRYEVDDRFPGWKGEVVDLHAKYQAEAQQAHPTQEIGRARHGDAKDWGYGSLGQENWRGEVDMLSWEPRVAMYKGFLSPAECIALRELAEASDTTGEMELHDDSDRLVSVINARIGQVTFFRRASMESLMISTVGPGTSSAMMFTPVDDQRAATFFIKLSDQPLDGGEIVLPKATVPQSDYFESPCAPGKLAFPMAQGDALLLHHKHVHNALDGRSAFEICPSQRRGEFWATQQLMSRRGGEPHDIRRW